MIYVLVTGKDSQIAQCIIDLQYNHHNVSFDFKNSKELDITSEESISMTFKAKIYDYCINCAAYTAVEKAETEQEKADLINRKGVKNLALACKLNDTTLIHISTDFVFDGEKKAPYKEEDETNPINFYGKTKRDGEIEIENILDKYFIIRTSWLYSIYGANFVKTILKLGRNKKELNVVCDQFGSPTHARDLAKAIIKIIKMKSQNYGVFHFSNIGSCSWYEFALKIFSVLKLQTDINKIEAKNYPSNVLRPYYSVLNSKKIQSELNIQIQNWETALERTLKRLD